MNLETPNLSRIPAAPGGLPLIGHSVALLRDPIALLSSLPKPMCRVRVGADDIVFVTDAELTSKVLVEDRIYDKGGPFYARGREIVGDGQGTCPHQRHRRQRRLCQPAFSAERIGSYVETMTRAIEETMREWRDDQVIDLGTELSGLSFRATAATMFSASLPEEIIREVASDLSSIEDGVILRTALPEWTNRLPIPANRRFGATVQRVRRRAAEVIAERRASGSDEGDLLSALLQARDMESREDAAFSDTELVDQVFTFFLGGAQTAAGCVSWALYLVSRHPEIESLLHEEVDSVLGGRTATQEDLPDLPLTTRVITETLRLYPATWLLTRQVSADTELGGVSLSAGTQVAVSPYAIHRDGTVYERANEFDPDRWVSTKPDRKTYIPFGFGARKCIGEQFGLIESTLALATIAGQWRLSSATAQPIGMSIKMIPVPDGMRMKLSRRRVGGS